MTRRRGRTRHFDCQGSRVARRARACALRAKRCRRGPYLIVGHRRAVRRAEGCVRDVPGVRRIRGARHFRCTSCQSQQHTWIEDDSTFGVALGVPVRAARCERCACLSTTSASRERRRGTDPYPGRRGRRAAKRELRAFSAALTVPIDSVIRRVNRVAASNVDRGKIGRVSVGLSGRGQDARGSRGSSAGARDFHDETWGQDVDWRFVWTTSRTLSRGRGLRVCGRHRRACYVAFSLA